MASLEGEWNLEVCHSGNWLDGSHHPGCMSEEPRLATPPSLGEGWKLNQTAGDVPGCKTC